MSPPLHCDTCDAPCAAVCVAHQHAGHPATAPGNLLRLARHGAHPWTQLCSSCGACEAVCPHDVAVRAGLRHRVAETAHEALVESWQMVVPWHVHTVVWAGCNHHGIDLDETRLSAAFRAHGVDDVQVAPPLSCGGEAALADEEMAAQIALRHAHVREIVVPTGACRAALSDLLRRAGLRGRTVAVLDQWLARFGVSVPRDSARFACCRMRRDERDIGVESSSVWPPAPTCCGAGRPLSAVAPAVAEAAGLALLRRWQEAGVHGVHVEDASCAAHLRQVNADHGDQMTIVTRLDAFLSTVPETTLDA